MSRSHSRNDGSRTDPRLAWDEGYATYAGCEILDSSIYIDTALGGASVIDISDTGERANPGGSLKQALSEYLVSEILWILSRGEPGFDGLGRASIFDVLGAYLPGGAFADRGVPGVDLVDFLDGLMCRAHPDPSGVRRVVVDERGFPYDFQGPASCGKPRAPVELALDAVGSPEALTLTLHARATRDIPDAAARFVLPPGTTVRSGRVESELGALREGEIVTRSITVDTTAHPAPAFGAGVACHHNRGVTLYRATALGTDPITVPSEVSGRIRGDARATAARPR